MNEKRERGERQQPEPAAPAAAHPAHRLRPTLFGTGAMALAAAAVILSYLAALAAIAADEAVSLNVTNLTMGDHIHPWLMFRGAFVDQSYPLDGYRTGVAPFYVPDLLVLFTLFALGVSAIAANLTMPLIFAAISAGGWIAVCALLYGRSAIRFAAVILLHAPPFLIVAAGPSDVYPLALLVVAHYGTWTCIPWLLFLALRTLEGSRPAISACGLATLLAATTASDLVIVPWFAAPLAAMLALFSQSALGKLLRYRLADRFEPARIRLAAAALGAGVIGGLLLAKASPFLPSRNVGAFLTPSIEGIISSFGHFTETMAVIALRNPASACLWLLFVAIAAWRLWVVLATKDRATLNNRTHDRLGVPAGASHAAVALYYPLAATAAVAAAVTVGNYGTAWSPDSLVSELRFILPAALFPLYTGWALLPWKSPGSAARSKILILAASGCAAVLAGAMAVPKLTHLAKFDVYASEFHECFASAAKANGWKGGIGIPSYNSLIADPDAGVNRYLPVGVWRSQEQDKSLVYLNWHIQNRHWFSGDFQFVVVNGHEQRAFFEPPIRANALNCHFSELASCVPPSLVALVLDDEAATGAFGSPQEIVECNGVAFYSYDPPIRLDYRNVADPDLTSVGEAF